MQLTFTILLTLLIQLIGHLCRYTKHLLEIDFPDVTMDKHHNSCCCNSCFYY